MPSGTSEVNKEQKEILAPPLNTFDLGERKKKLALKLYDPSRTPNFVWTHFSEPSDVLEKADNQGKLFEGQYLKDDSLHWCGIFRLSALKLRWENPPPKTKGSTVTVLELRVPSQCIWLS